MARLPALHFPVRAYARWIVPFFMTLTLVLTFTMALWPASVFAATIYVDGTNCTLPAAIDSANSNSNSGNCVLNGTPGVETLIVTGTYSFNSGPTNADGSNALPDITSSMIISSSGETPATVERSGANRFRLFHINSGGVLTLTNIIVFNGDNATGGNFGGGIFNRGKVILEGSQVLSSTSNSGGGIYNLGNLVLTASWILTNSVSEEGGGIYNNGGVVTVTGSRIVANMADGTGGGFYNAPSSTATISDTRVLANEASDGGGIYNDFAVVSNVTVNKSTIAGNLADNQGGGILNFGKLTVNDSELSSNEAYEGGALYNTLNAMLTGNRILSNTVDWSGGGIYNSGGTLIVEGGVLQYNWAKNNGGGAIFNTNVSTLHLSNAEMSHNKAFNGGGLLNEGGSNADILATPFTYNTSTSGAGAIFNVTDTVTITDSDIFSNSSAIGGAIYNGGKVSLRNSDVSYNNASLEAGGILNNIYATLALTDSDVFSNYATFAGGGIVNSSVSTVTLSNANIVANLSMEAGGILNNLESVLMGIDSDIISNTASSTYGGGIENYGNAVIALTNSHIYSNTAGDSGGAFYNTDNSTVTLDNATLYANSAITGGAIYNSYTGTVTLLASPIFSNTASSSGGGLYNQATVHITGGALNANQAVDGAGLYNITGAATISGVQILSNSATGNGGGIHSAHNGNVSLTNSILRDNQAGGTGSALYHDQATTSVSQSCVVNNRDTAVAYAAGSNVTATNDWWGASDGPSGVAGGAGDSVSNHVTFTPYKSSAILGCPSLPSNITFGKSVTPLGPVLPGEPVTFTLHVSNEGGSDVKNIYVSDPPPAGFQLTQVSSSGAPISTTDNSYRIPVLEAGDAVTLSLIGKADPALDHDLLIANSATLTNGLTGELTATKSINVIPSHVDLSQSHYEAGEASGAFSATITLTPPNPYVTVTVEAAYTDSVQASFFAEAVQVISFAPGSNSQQALVPIVNDQGASPRTIVLALQNPVGAKLGVTSSATISITEDDVLGLVVDKRVNRTQAQAGDALAYTYAITNTGNVTLTIVAKDNPLGGIGALNGALAPNVTISATLTYTVKADDPIGPLNNTVTVTGTDSLANSIVVTDSASVTIINNPTNLPGGEQPEQSRQDIFLPVIKP